MFYSGKDLVCFPFADRPALAATKFLPHDPLRHVATDVKTGLPIYKRESYCVWEETGQ